MQRCGNRLEPDLCWELQMESVVGTGVRGDSVGVVIVGAGLCPLKKRCQGGREQKKKDIEVLTTPPPPPVPKSRTVFGNKVFTEYSS